MKTTFDTPDDCRKRLKKLAEELGTFDSVISREDLLRLRESDCRVVRSAGTL